MNEMPDEHIELLIHRYLEGDCPPEVVEELRAAMEADPAVVQILFNRSEQFLDLVDTLREERIQAAEPAGAPAKLKVVRGSTASWQRWMVPLAAAASVVIVAGAWWFSQRQDGALGLRVAEVRGKVSGFRVQGSGGKESGVTASPSHQVAKTEVGGQRSEVGGRRSEADGRQPNTEHRTPATPLRVGDVIRPGDGVEVGADGFVKLAYLDGTQVELRQNTRLRLTLGAGREKTAKRLALDSGTLVCTAAPQKLPFEVTTRHAVARVVGTRFSLAVADRKTTLAVQEGKVALCQGEKVVEVSAGETATASDKGLAQVQAQGGRVWTWGENQYGQLGDGTTNSRPNPARVPNLSDVIAITAGVGGPVAVHRDQTVWSWGRGTRLLTGDSTTGDGPVQVKTADGSPLSGIIAIAKCNTHIVALRRDQTVWAWGDNLHGQLGNGPTNAGAFPVQVKMPDGTPFSGCIAIAAGRGFTVALKADRTVWAWGYNGDGQLGDGTAMDRHFPVQVKMADGTPLADMVAITAGCDRTVALKADRTVWAWGNNSEGRLGDGTLETHRLAPVQVKLPEAVARTGIIAIAAKWNHTVALTSDGLVVAWGSNNRGQLGDGTTTNRYAPVQVKLSDGTPLSGIAAVAVGHYHTMAIASGGRVWAWGSNHAGQLGDGTRVNRLSPVPVQMRDGTNLAGVAAIAAGFDYTVALLDESTKGDAP